MRYDDLCDASDPVLSVITPSLNHAAFLRETIETVAAQSFRRFEHIVVDGGSTDGTVEILKDYPHLRWISEQDRGVLDAYQKALSRVRGKYVIQCCVSDGFLSRGWFQRAVGLLDADPSLSLVWALPQYMTEQGELQGVSYADYLADPPPEREDYLPFWWANKLPFPEGNYCVRSNILRKHFPTEASRPHFQVHCHLGFMYHFMVQGYLSRFVPEVVNFGRTHSDQRGTRLWHVERPAQFEYFKEVDRHRRGVLGGDIAQVFRDGASNPIKTAGAADLKRMRRVYWSTRIFRSPLLRYSPYEIKRRVMRRLGAFREQRRKHAVRD